MFAVLPTSMHVDQLHLYRRNDLLGERHSYTVYDSSSVLKLPYTTRVGLPSSTRGDQVLLGDKRVPCSGGEVYMQI